MSIIKYASPFTDFELFPARMFQDSMTRLFAEPNGRPWVPPVDIQETENELILKADVPEVEMKDIDVSLENGTLTIRGERKFEAKKDEGGWHRVEREIDCKASGAKEKPKRVECLWMNYAPPGDSDSE